MTDWAAPTGLHSFLGKEMKETSALLPSLQDAAIEAAPSVELVINLLLLL